MQQLVGQRRLQLAHAFAERGDLVLQLQDAADALQAHTLGAQPRDLPQLHHIAHRIAPRLAGGALRAHQGESVVLAQRLRVHARELRGDRDREDGVVGIHGYSAFARCRISARGFSFGCSFWNASRASLASGLRCAGTATTTVASRSPPPLAVVTPRPLTRSTRPDGVPGATLSFTGSPPRVGTSMVAPSAASVKVTGTSTRRLSPSRSKTGCLRTVTVSVRSPAVPPSGLGSPFPLSRIFWPSFTPAGIFTLIALPPCGCSLIVSPRIAVRKSRVVLAVRSLPRLGPWAPNPPPRP